MVARGVLESLKSAAAAANMVGGNWQAQLGGQQHAYNMNSNYVQASAPQGALTYTSANLGI